MPLDTARKAPAGLERLVFFPLTADTDAALTYGTAYPMVKALMTIDDQATSYTATMYVEGMAVDMITVSTGGTINIGITQLNAQDHITILGKTEKGKGYISNKNDATPFVGVAYMSTNSDGTVNLHKIFKAKFSKGNKSRATIGDGAPTFQTDTLNGTFSATIFDGNSKAEVFNLNRTTDATLITTWFTDGKAVVTGP